MYRNEYGYPVLSEAEAEAERQWILEQERIYEQHEPEEHDDMNEMYNYA